MLQNDLNTKRNSKRTGYTEKKGSVDVLALVLQRSLTVHLYAELICPYLMVRPAALQEIHV